MRADPIRLRRGNFVMTYFDTGALGPAPLFGVVIAAGPLAFTVRWESGLVNRIRQEARGGLTRIPRHELDTRALEALEPAAERAR